MNFAVLYNCTEFEYRLVQCKDNNYIHEKHVEHFLEHVFLFEYNKVLGKYLNVETHSKTSFVKTT